MDRIELGHDPAPAHDREVLASVLYRIEDVGEVPCCLGRTHFRHGIRLSDTRAHNVRQVRLPLGGESTRDGTLNAQVDSNDSDSYSQFLVTIT